MGLFLREEALLHQHAPAPVSDRKGTNNRVSQSGYFQFITNNIYLSKAFANLIEEMKWKTFVIIYEDEDSLIRLQVNNETN